MSTTRGNPLCNGVAQNPEIWYVDVPVAVMSTHSVWTWTNLLEKL